MRLLLLITVFIFHFNGLAVEIKQPPIVGKIITVKGKVELTRNEQIIKAKRKTQLKELDNIKTGNKAKTQIRFNDGTITTLGKNSEMIVEQYKWRKGEPTPQAKFTLVEGVFRTVTGLITKVDDPHFSVQTPVGSIGIRGTDFWGGYLEKDSVDVLFIDGEHSIEVSNEFGTVILEKPGQGTTIRPGLPPTKAKKWPQSKVDRAIKTIE